MCSFISLVHITSAIVNQESVEQAVLQRQHYQHALQWKEDDRILFHPIISSKPNLKQNYCKICQEKYSANIFHSPFCCWSYLSRNKVVYLPISKQNCELNWIAEREYFTKLWVINTYMNTWSLRRRSIPLPLSPSGTQLRTLSTMSTRKNSASTSSIIRFWNF